MAVGRSYVDQGSRVGRLGHLVPRSSDKCVEPDSDVGE